MKNLLYDQNNRHRSLFIVLFLSSLLMGIYQIAIIKQLTVTMYNVQASAYICFTFLHIFSGLGSYLAYRFFNSLLEYKNIRRLFLSSGSAIIFSLFCVLSFQIEQPVSIGMTVFFVSFVFLALGIIYGLTLIYFCRTTNTMAGKAVATSLVGLMLGFLVEPYMAVYVGVNATLLWVGLACIILYVQNPLYSYMVLPLILGVLAINPIDSALEQLRTKTINTNQRVSKEDLEKNYTQIYDRWSPYAKLNIYKNNDETQHILFGAYNYRIFWSYNKKKEPRKIIPFAFITETDRILVIGASAGQEINRIRQNRKTTKENTTMVEIDPMVVKYFKYEHPEYNDNLFNRVHIIAADGRSVLDEMRERQDVIILGTMESAARNIWMFSEFKNNLYTIESFRRCFELLGDSGVLMIYRDENNPVLVNSMSTALRMLGVHFVVYRIPFHRRDEGLGQNRFYIYASKDRERLDNIDAIFQESRLETEPINPHHASIITDDRNFTNMLNSSSEIVLRTFLISVCAIFFLMLAVLLLVKRKKSRRIMIYFFLIGNGFFLTQLFLIAKFKSFFGQPIKTFMVVTFIFLLCVSIGNFLAHRLAPGELRRRFLPHISVVILVMLWSALAISHIPFHVSTFVLKILVAVMIIAPIGLLCGIYYPLGLTLGKNEHLGQLIFFDSLGASLAFFVFYLIYWISGVSMNFYPLAFCYLAATAIISLCYSGD